MDTSNLYNRSPIIDTIFGNSGQVIESINNLNKQIPIITEKIDILNNSIGNLNIDNRINLNSLLKTDLESSFNMAKSNQIELPLNQSDLNIQKGGNIFSSIFRKIWNNKLKIIKILVIMFVIMFLLYVISKFNKKKEKSVEKGNNKVDELNKLITEMNKNVIEKPKSKKLNYDPDDE